MIRLYDYIGEPAMLEQFAEECVELAHVCLKYARFIRGENACDSSVNETMLRTKLCEEMADVHICFELVADMHNVPYEYDAQEKEDRMVKRLINSEAAKKAKEDNTIYIKDGGTSYTISASPDAIKVD